MMFILYFLLLSVPVLSIGLHRPDLAANHRGDCFSDPPKPTNGYQLCTPERCTAYCNQGYVFTHTNHPFMPMYCWASHWRFEWTQNTTAICIPSPKLLPTLMPPVPGYLHNSKRSHTYRGACPSIPPSPTNGYQSCTEEKCTAICNDGYVFARWKTSSQPMYCWKSVWYFDWTWDTSAICIRRTDWIAPYAPPSCPTPIDITCKTNQISKQVTNAAGCITNVCECKQCVPIDQSKPLQPGQFRQIKNDGCCDYEEVTCKPELCPVPTVCKPNERSEEVKSIEQCCSTYKCIAREGCISDRAVGTVHKYEFFQVGEVWSDGPCTNCTCLSDPIQKSRAVCSTHTCPNLPDDLNFSYHISRTDQQCCPNVQYVACKYNGEEFAEGESRRVKTCWSLVCLRETTGELVKKLQRTHCNTDCGMEICEKTCSVLGYSHYTKFNGEKFDFTGELSFYLVQNDNFEVIRVNAESDVPTYIKSIIVKADGHLIRLEQNRVITADDKYVRTLPYTVSGITIRSVSSMFISVQLPNGLNVKWDGLFRTYITAPPSLVGQTKGLCGPFNDDDSDDDFLTADSTSHNIATKHLCEVAPGVEAIGKKHCQHLKSNIFLDCHPRIDPEIYYENCVRDVCSCQGDRMACACSMIAAYADECKSKDVTIDWRKDVTICRVQCQNGQSYKTCTNNCRRTCRDISVNKNCKDECVEDCSCPTGQALDDNGFCVPIENCDCYHNEKVYKAGQVFVKSGQGICTCVNAMWNCKNVPQIEVDEYQVKNHLKCDPEKNLKFTRCKAVEQQSCQNMHQKAIEPEIETCKAGCDCKEDFVVDTHNKCVPKYECPCFHGGRSYDENDYVQRDCNTCTCHAGLWICTQRKCSKECSAWGDSHFKTFDGKLYDFQGQCDYVLTKGELDEFVSFQVSIQNVACGSLGVSCSKSITVSITTGTKRETIKLIRDEIPERETHEKLSMRDVGLFIIVEAVGMGLLVHWDKGTRVYVKIDEQWKNKVVGLCGNYNDNAWDDFQKPDGAIEATSAAFARSWRLSLYCPEPQEPKNTCDLKPERRSWAIKQCQNLKSAVFEPCHSKVPVDSYFEKCTFDSCACDDGGDCECLCTAIAAYAQECNNAGVPVNWRRRNFCPTQCDGFLHYNPCISICPYEHCESSDQTRQFCKKDTCIEGCSPKLCPSGHVYLNTSFVQCVPKDSCKSVCLQIDDKIYYEDDVIKREKCHVCRCRDGKQICTDESCEEETICNVPVPITCKSHEVLKTTKDKFGCVELACECKKCEPINYQQKLLPGQFRLVKYNGCCTYETLICRPEFCPGPPDCPSNEVANEIESEGQCCPTYKCVPQEGCTVTRTIGDLQKEEVLEVGKYWNDGPCTRCICIFDAILGYRSNCTTRTCPSHMDHENFVYKTISSPQECCPKFEKVACKFEGKGYEEGTSWYLSKCTTETCYRTINGDLIKKLRQMHCNTNCDPGYKYVTSPDICCGKCVQYGCIVGNEIRLPGETWTKGSCDSFTCEKIGDQFAVTKLQICLRSSYTI